MAEPPVTPKKQITYTTMDLDLEQLDCTPDTKAKMISNKRKASQMLSEGSPTITSPFLKWRLTAVEQELQVKAMEKKALLEASKFFEKSGKTKAECIAMVKSKEEELLEEKILLLSSRQILHQDINDLVSEKVCLEDAYIKELMMALSTASSARTKLPGMKTPRLDRSKFSQVVNTYLDTKTVVESEAVYKWCNVLGYWFPSEQIRCAHIVPFSWNTKDLAYMFGSEEAPLTSPRNGLSLYAKIEEGFDNCWIVIVPIDSVASVPIEWKIVLLNQAIRDNICYSDFLKITDRPHWRWRDLDGRKLSFRNENRPARRFLYARYALAWLHAEASSWTDFKEKVPPGEIWASPNKPDGYLRKSILVALGKKTGDKLPKDLIQAGIFEDEDTSNAVKDQVAEIRVNKYVQQHLDGERDIKEIDEEDRDGDEEEGTDVE